MGSAEEFPSWNPSEAAGWPTSRKPWTATRFQSGGGAETVSSAAGGDRPSTAIGSHHVTASCLNGILKNRLVFQRSDEASEVRWGHSRFLRC